MRPYETLLVLKPDLEEETIDALMERFTGVITGEDGTIDNIDRWGKRRLAYEINGFTEGFYVVIDFKAESGATSEVERILKITDEVVRYLLVRRDQE